MDRFDARLDGVEGQLAMFEQCMARPEGIFDSLREAIAMATGHNAA